MPVETSLAPHDAVGSPVETTSGQSAPTIDIDFHPSRIDSKNFPFALWKSLFNELLNQRDCRMLDYGAVEGELGLRRELAKYLHYSRGVRCGPEQIVIGNGIQYCIWVIRTLLNENPMVAAMENPGYHRVRAILEHSGVPIRPIRLDHDGLDIDQLCETDANIVYVTPSHQFPKGMVMPYYKRMLLLRWAQAVNGFIIEDDYDSEFRYGERPIPSLQGLDQRDSVIYIGTFSKAFTPAIRMNYMVLPPPLLARFKSISQGFDCPVSRIQQNVMEMFMTRGFWDGHIRRFRRIYRGKHQDMLHALRVIMENHVVVSGIGAGLHVALLVRTTLTERDLTERAARMGVRIYTGNDTRIGPSNDLPYVYLGFGALERTEMEEGLRRLKNVWFDD